MQRETERGFSSAGYMNAGLRPMMSRHRTGGECGEIMLGHPSGTDIDWHSRGETSITRIGPRSRTSPHSEHWRSSAQDHLAASA